MAKIRLIVTDLDGTLTGNDTEQAYSTQLADVIGQYRSKYDAIWAICSGRSASYVRDSVEALHQLGLNSDFVIVRNSLVYRTGRHIWHPMRSWNWSMRVHNLISFFYLKSALRDWQRELNRTFKNVICLYRRKSRLCLRFRNREDADAGAEVLRRKARTFRHVRVFQYLSEVEVRTVIHTKGMAVENLAERLHIKGSETLCIGNGMSDMSMLDASFAAHTGCPANAEMDVIDHVHQTKGHIAGGKSMLGVVEILQAYLRGDICSDLPSWWSSSHIPKHSRLGGSRGRPPPRQPMRPNERTALQVGLLSAYVILVVFASFDLVPFSHIIMQPFVIVAGWVARIFELFM